MAKQEQKRQQEEAPAGSGAGLGIRFTADDLAELALRARHAALSHGTVSGTGAMSFSRRSVQADRQTAGLISQLEQSGRARVEERIPARSGCMDSGNVVVYPKRNGDRAVLIETVGAELLRPIARLYGEQTIPVESVTILPNTSSDKPKGLVIALDRKADKPWLRAPQLNWQHGRGLLVTSLQMDTDEFIERSDLLLAGALAAGKRTEPGELKYLQFAYDAQGRMYMVMAGGPSHRETDGMMQAIVQAKKAHQAQEILNAQNEFGRIKRTGLAMDLAHSLRLTVDDFVADATYIDADLDAGLVFSGAAQTTANGLKPFTLGDSRIILHTQGQGEITPVGAKTASSSKKDKPALPPGVIIDPPSKTVISPLFGAEEVEEYVHTLPNRIELEVLGLGYHTDMRRERR